MVYARFASGYRPGGPNPVPGVPRQYDPDRTQDYDLGVKGDFLDHRLSIDASVYYIHWKDIQLGLYTPTFQSYTGNAGAAKSEGVELAVQAKPLSGLSIAGWVAWNEAVLTTGFPNTGNILGAPGDRLPYASRWSGNLSLEQTFPLWSGTSGFVGGMVSYVGDRQGEFVYVLPRQILSSYTEVNLSGGIAKESWRLNLFVNNVADKRGELAGGLGSFPPYAFTYIQPRTVGISVVKTF
jgi:outer membrane receptor protein involved in Fe transport